MHICMYVCLSVCLSVCLYVCVRYLYVYVCIVVGISFCMSVGLHVCMCLYVCLSVCLYVCLYVCMSVCLYMSVSLYACTHATATESVTKILVRSTYSAGMCDQRAPYASCSPGCWSQISAERVRTPLVTNSGGVTYSTGHKFRRSTYSAPRSWLRFLWQ